MRLMSRAPKQLAVISDLHQSRALQGARHLGHRYPGNSNSRAIRFTVQRRSPVNAFHTTK